MSRSHLLLSLLALAGLGLALSGPALAATAASIPEPTNLALLALGLTGLVLGRQAARRRRDD
jgi:hypothetical protein